MTFSPLVVEAGQTRQLPTDAILTTNPPAIRVSRSTNQVIATSTYTAISFDTQVFSFGGSWWSSSSNPDRITVPVSGIYLIGGFLRISASSTTHIQSAITLNGSTNIHVQTWPVSATNRPYDFSNQILHQLSQGDYLQLRFATSLGSYTISPESGVTPAFWAIRMR